MTKLFTEGLLIWNIYETIRPRVVNKIKSYSIITDRENKYIKSKIEALEAKKDNHGWDINKLEMEINKIIWISSWSSKRSSNIKCW
ncbi:hypothetical protein ONA00_03270 [Mycoplasmopsis cynos]|uniref:hypothetical protein n=1 Tax=Mycoplasmopsis cynos TaxID=171284 RepID=UPI0024C8E76A|nr:hypothetical protein [Mycoplasmopsis cynos]WAM11447.1 hypothetical protein ONA00_03270 [Mycoplasmopsis cynos]